MQTYNLVKCKSLNQIEAENACENFLVNIKLLASYVYIRNSNLNENTIK